MEFTQDKRETDPLLTSVLDGNWPSGGLFLEHISTRGAPSTRGAQ